MSVYTISINELINSNFDFGLQDYPIFDENYRQTLNNNILNYFLFEEIGLETPQAFKIALNNKMNIIMPKYNILYENNKKLFESNLIEKYESRGNIQENKKNKNVYQDTPQGIVKQQDIENYTYATNSNLNGSQNITDNVISYTKSIQGNNSLNIDIFKKVVDNFKNIDIIICEKELNGLFMPLY